MGVSKKDLGFHRGLGGCSELLSLRLSDGSLQSSSASPSGIFAQKDDKWPESVLCMLHTSFEFAAQWEQLPQ